MVELFNQMSQNVRTKAVRMTIFLSSQDQIRRDKRMLCRKKRFITSHNSRPYGWMTIPYQRLSETRWTISRISNRCWKHFTRSSLSKNVLITQRKICLSDPGDIGNMPQILWQGQLRFGWGHL